MESLLCYINWWCGSSKELIYFYDLACDFNVTALWALIRICPGAKPFCNSHQPLNWKWTMDKNRDRRQQQETKIKNKIICMLICYSEMIDNRVISVAPPGHQSFWCSITFHFTYLFLFSHTSVFPLFVYVWLRPLTDVMKLNRPGLLGAVESFTLKGLLSPFISCSSEHFLVISHVTWIKVMINRKAPVWFQLLDSSTACAKRTCWVFYTDGAVR